MILQIFIYNFDKVAAVKLFFFGGRRSNLHFILDKIFIYSEIFYLILTLCFLC